MKKLTANSYQLSACRSFSESGVALMMVLWILVLLGIISLNFLTSTRWNTASTRNLKEETTAYYLAMSGFQEALGYIVSDKNQAVDFEDAEGNFWVDDETPPVTGIKEVDGGEVDIRISDEDAKVNINVVPSLSPPQEQTGRVTVSIDSLLRFAGIPEDDINVIRDSIQDWKDSGDQDSHMLEGAESDYYEDLDPPYKAKNGLFDVPEELALVKGVKYEYLYGVKGDEEVKPLLRLITTFGEGGPRYNINTVSREMMGLMGLDESQIEFVMKQRTAEFKGHPAVPGDFSAYGFNTTSTSNFRIEVTARANKGGPASKITAVVNRQPGTKGFKIQTLYWRESAENTGS